MRPYKKTILYGLPKVPSSYYPLSPRRGERVRVRGDEKKLLASAIVVNPR
jgi:hypothetical protein